MRNLYLRTMLMLCAIVFGVGQTWAAGYTRTLTADITVDGYENAVLYDFQNNDPAVLPTEGDLRYREGGIWGLHNFGSGTRKADVAIPVKAGQLVVMQGYNGDISITANATANSAASTATGYVCYNITADAENFNIQTLRYSGVVAVVVMDKQAGVVDEKYTVNYFCGEDTIESKTDLTGQVGTVPFVAKDAIYKDGKKYIYVSDDAEGQTIAADGSTVVTVQCREAATYTFTVEEDGGTVLYKGSGFEGDEAKYYIPYYLLGDDNSLYCKPGTPQYGEGTILLDADKKVVGLTYTLDENQNAVFYAEAEDIATLKAYEDSYTQIRMSNGKAAYAEADGAVVATLSAPGKYTLTSATRAGSATFSVNGNEVLTVSSSGAVTVGTSTEFSIFGQTDITVSAGNAKNYFDYVLIRKTGDVTEEDRQAANFAAAQADMTKLEDVQAKLTQATLGNEEFISEAENAQISIILGDTYTMMISDAYAAVAESGVYATPIDWAALNAEVDGIISNINARKEGLIPMYTEKGVVGDGTEMSESIPFYNTPVTVDVYAADQYANEKVVVKAWDGVEGSDLYIRFAKMGWEEEMVVITDLVQTVNGDTVSYYEDNEENPEYSMFYLKPQAGDYSMVGIFPNNEMSTVLVGTDEEVGMGQLSLYGLFYPKAAASEDDDPDAGMGVAMPFEAAYIVTWPGEPQVKPITEARTWDFANGGAHQADIVGNTDYWSESSKGRYALAVDLVDQELPGIGGVALAGMEGLYLTVGKGAVYGVTGQYCLQNNDIMFRIPECAAGDTITVEYCSATKSTEVVLASDNLTEGSSTTSTSKQSFSSTVVTDGDVIVTLANSKGSRLYTVSVAPCKEDPTAISEVAAKAPVANGVIYNLAGQVVSSDYKGIVIKNGKKVSVK